MATDIVITDLTEGSLTGNGVFDKLMAAVNAHIDDQYNKNRITGTDYATVYLGSMQSVIQQSVEYILQEKQIEAQVDLLVQQKLNAEKEGTLLDAQLEKLDIEVKAIIAKTEDEHGIVLDKLNANSVSTSTETAHHLSTEKLKNDVASSELDVDLKQSDINVKSAQEELYLRQTVGFDDNKKQKAIDKALDIWAIAFSALPASQTIPSNLDATDTGLWAKAIEDLKNIIAE